MKNLYYLIIICFLILGSTFDSYSKRKPKWITERPINKEYYIGIGKADKESNDDYIQTAKSNALADMISEISVKISSNSILNQVEDATGLRERYEATIQLSVKDDISDYEIVDTWENKKEYWVYYRLSKADYQRKKRERLERAKNLSKDYYEKGKEAEKVYDINNAIIYYIKAFEPIEKHLGEDLSTFTLDGKVILDNAIYQSIQSILSRIKIVPEKEVFTIKSLSSQNDPVNVKVKLKTDLETQNIGNVPIIFSFPDLNISKEEVVLSRSNGLAECTIASLAPKGKNQIIKAEFNIDSYFAETIDDNILKNIVLGNIIRPYTNLNIEVKELFAYLESEEKLWGNRNTVEPITQFFKEELSENFFSFTPDKEKADVIIKISAELIKGTKLDKHNLHTAFLNCSISIKDLKNNLVIFNDGLSNIKGIKSGSFESAAEDAFKKGKNKINTDIIPSIRKIKL